MRLQYLGHSCFRIISEMNTAIICDPYQAKMVGFAMPKLSCDVITISHHHRDHDCIEEVAGNPVVLEGNVRVAVDDVAVETIQTFHDDKQGKLRGENTVFCFLADGLRVVHMGDVGVLDENLAAKLAGCDVLMLPVGGIFTIDANGADWYVKKIQPKIVVPMHYKTENLAFELDGVEKFLALQKPQNIKILADETLKVDDLPQNTEPLIAVPKAYID